MAEKITRVARRAAQHAETRQDARIRAFRSFIQGLIIDGLLAVSIVLLAALKSESFTWSAEYWQLVAMSIIKTALISMVSYVMRHMSPPSNAP